MSNRRDFLQSLAGGAAAWALAGPALLRAGAAVKPYRHIGCEEHFLTPELLAELRRVSGGVASMKSGPIRGPFVPALLDVGEGRLAAMDAAGIDMQVLSVPSPGVQELDPATAVSLMRATDDRLADIIRQHPTRFAGLAVVAPQAPAASARELERAVRMLGLKGGIVHSHTHNEYLDNQKFWEIFEAAQTLDVPIYLHPREPSEGMAKPLAIPGFSVGWGYGVETGTHALRLIASGVFDRFPRLRIVLGHLGETLPFLFGRLDNRYVWEMNTFHLAKMKRLPSEYIREHFVVTTSGMNFSVPLRATLEALGPERILFADDYPMEVLPDQIKGFESTDMPDDVRRRIYETNATRVFKL